eukprot:m.158532 g.158532  ORF g.158532 m.158532 type:complete len:67 (-) comp15139_c0_seq3:199-399(-)
MYVSNSPHSATSGIGNPTYDQVIETTAERHLVNRTYESIDAHYATAGPSYSEALPKRTPSNEISEI